MDEQTSLSPDNILIAEFEYLTQAAAQANEDRARVASFYLVSFGSFIAGLVTTRFTADMVQSAAINLGFAALFLALALMGVLTVMQLARLRMAWYDTARALNHIKQYYVDHISGLNLSDAFLWKNDTLPRKFKMTSVAFSLVLQVSVLGGVSLGASLYLLLAGLRIGSGLVPAIITGVVFMFVQVWLYRRMMK
jgi:hypothetical protein